MGIRYRGTLFLGYFLWGEQQEVTRHSGEKNIKKLLEAKSPQGETKSKLLLIQPFQNLILHLCPNPILNPGMIL